ncbi:hypothetical protein EVAR_45297_1 [Eumeta japonica]|uniref:Uncharacterized protein n=1 Tax=Eumeta variegata TaxID=151549 RepID=A0A4C1YAR3_EUMVA|nr:hypothetical protein EVAR_45297_1 [Eumeta japonica]
MRPNFPRSHSLSRASDDKGVRDASALEYIKPWIPDVIIALSSVNSLYQHLLLYWTVERLRSKFFTIK